MSTAQHAGRILDAWSRADAVAFENEVEGALAACRTGYPLSALEYEQRELLESVAERFQARHASPPMDAGLALLRHLHARAAV
ncbi:MAG: hypothetical protein ACRD4O_14385 [Bryobacteraceae bacterium]